MKTVIGVIVEAWLFIALASLPVWWLWNSLMPEIFGLPQIGYWQAVGLMLLAGILLRTGMDIDAR